jgi:hypothetical protein
MRHFTRQAVLLASGFALLSACATGDDRTARQAHEFQNVDPQPAVSGKEYRDRNPSDPRAPYADPHNDGR